LLRAVIVDDEVPVLNLLKMVLEKTGMVKIEQSYTNSIDALKNIEIIQPEVVFLDIEMPEMNGLELAGHLIGINPDLMVVFVTGYNQYALEAFGVNALDYILKPVTPNNIDKCISRLLNLRGIKYEKVTSENEKGIYCLSDFSVIGENGPIKWVTRKVEELLAYFIVNRNTNIDGWELGEILWPEAEPGRIKANLHTAIFRLRKTIYEEGLPIEIFSEKGGNGIYRCSINNLFCDLIEFESALRTNIVTKGNIEEMERISRLYQEDLFYKKDYPWCEAKKTWLRQGYVRVLLSIADYYEKDGDGQKAIQVLLKAGEKESFDEEIHRRLLSACYHQKNAALMSKLHHEFQQRLAEEIGIKPQTETTELYSRLMGKYRID
jgi:two-component SAPR family response regulator